MTDFVIITENPLFGLDEGDRTGSTQYIWLDYVDSETSFVIFASVYHHVGPLALIQQKFWFTSLGVTAIFIHSLPFFTVNWTADWQAISWPGEICGLVSPLLVKLKSVELEFGVFWLEPLSEVQTKLMRRSEVKRLQNFNQKHSREVSESLSKSQIERFLH